MEPTEATEQREERVFVLEGVVNIATVRLLHDAARQLAEGEGNVAVSCAGLERLDTAGAQVLLALKRRLEAKGHTLHMRDVPERVIRLLSVAGIAKALDIQPPTEASPPAASTESSQVVETATAEDQVAVDDGWLSENDLERIFSDPREEKAEPRGGSDEEIRRD